MSLLLQLIGLRVACTSLLPASMQLCVSGTKTVEVNVMDTYKSLFVAFWNLSNSKTRAMEQESNPGQWLSETDSYHYTIRIVSSQNQ